MKVQFQKSRKLDPRLIILAKMTPKKWGKEILDRNTLLLKKVKLLKKYIGKEIPDDVIEKSSEVIKLGCPHCKDSSEGCEYCLWQKRDVKVKGHNTLSCIYMPFYGVSYMDLNEYPVNVRYTDNSAFLGSFLGILGQDNYKDVVDFLEGHIAWAKMIQKYGTA